MPPSMSTAAGAWTTRRELGPDLGRAGAGRRGSVACGRAWRRSWSARCLSFALGVALGLALDDRPVPGGTQTVVRTLEPLPQQPAP